MASTWSRMIKWTILTTKLLFKHGMVFTWSSASSSWVLVWNLLKSFWNYHHSERSTFEIIIIKKVILRSQLFPTCPKENGHRCLKSGWKQVGGTWSAVAAPPTRPPILYISLYEMVSIWYIICKKYIYMIIYFYRTRVRSLGMLVSDWLTHWLTHSVTFSKLDWCNPGV